MTDPESAADPHGQPVPPPESEPSGLIVGVGASVEAPLGLDEASEDTLIAVCSTRFPGRENPNARPAVAMATTVA